ncbi:hypothetical protein [Acinetobacter junii]|uniref:Uncharacterized protein n=1 Tax=Acinetobacter junii TaxID=40215 RepID=A0AAW5RBN3_ACIJU|nr:hypothetical protein [Acinetobacter junii]MCU4398128.1 hypothetical protein [Acinetobacter junii]
MDEQTTDLKKTIEDLKNKIMQDSIFKPMVNVALIAGGILIAYKGALIIGIQLDCHHSPRQISSILGLPPLS